MDVFEALTTRRSVRKYEPTPVPDADLERILEAARLAPSWANTQCWELIVIRNAETKRQLCETLTETNPARRAVVDAPVLIAACGRRGLSGMKGGQPTTKHGDWFLFDVALILHQLSLAAWDLGLGTVHVGLFDHDAAARILGVPEGVEVVELMPLGRPAGPARPAPSRKPLSDFVFSEKYGQK